MYTFNILVRRTGTCRRSIGEHTVYHVHQAFNPFQIFSFLFQLSNKETFSSGTVEFSDNKCLAVCAVRTVINYTGQTGLSQVCPARLNLAVIRSLRLSGVDIKHLNKTL